MTRLESSDPTYEPALEDALTAEAAPERAVPTTPVPPEGVEDDRRADAAERDLTTALAALRRRGKRAIDRVESVLEPKHLAIGAGVIAGLAALVVLSRRRGVRRSGPASIGSTIARSIVREALGRMVLGAAATAGARLAEAAVPLLVASLSTHQVGSPTRRRRAARGRAAAPSAPRAADELE